MNKVELIGRFTNDPDVRHAGQSNMAIARFTIAVDRRFKKDGDAQTADFITCVAFGKTAEFIESYCYKGIKMALSGRIQTGSYTNKDGQKIYTTDVVVEEIEFCEKKSGDIQNSMPKKEDDFMNLPEGVDDEIPFN